MYEIVGGYTPSHATTFNILNELGFETIQERSLGNAISKIDFLGLGQNYTLLIEIICGFNFNFPSDQHFWVEIGIKNGKILEKSVPVLSVYYSYDYHMKVQNAFQLNERVAALISESKESFRKIVWPYREQLIEFIKTQSE